MLTKDVKQGERTDLSAAEKSSNVNPVSPAYVSMARYVLRHDEALAQSVMSGAETLNAAYKIAKENAAKKERAAEAEQARREKLDMLRTSTRLCLRNPQTCHAAGKAEAGAPTPLFPRGGIFAPATPENRAGGAHRRQGGAFIGGGWQAAT